MTCAKTFGRSSVTMATVFDHILVIFVLTEFMKTTLLFVRKQKKLNVLLMWGNTAFGFAIKENVLHQRHYRYGHGHDLF